MRGPLPQMNRRQCLQALGTLSIPLLLPTPGYGLGRQWRISGYDVPELRSFDQAIEQFMQARNIRLGSLAVARRGRLLLAHGYSWDESGDALVEPASLFRIASVAKPFTAAVTLRLLREAGVDVSTPVSALLPDVFPHHRGRDPRLDAVTVLHLLQHQGGWDRSRSFDPVFHDATIARTFRTGLPVDRGHIAAFMARQRVDMPPGTTFSYSNFGYLLLGLLIERLSGTSYEDAVRARLLEPLGIGRMRLGRTAPELRTENEVTYDADHQAATVLNGSGRKVPAPYGAFNLENGLASGGWIASPVDLLRVSGAFAPTTPVPEAIDTALLDQALAMPSTGLGPTGEYYGCGWSVRPLDSERRNMWHTGSLPGTTSTLLRRWDGLDVAVVFNRREEYAATPADQYLNALDQGLGVAMRGVQVWPTHNLFDEYEG